MLIEYNHLKATTAAGICVFLFPSGDLHTFV